MSNLDTQPPSQPDWGDSDDDYDNPIMQRILAETKAAKSAQ